MVYNKQIKRIEMSTSKEHWNTIFTTNKNSELGWYEKDVTQTFKFIQEISLDSSSRVFVAGAGISLLVDKLLNKEYQLILNDISDEALNSLKNRLKEAKQIEWLHHDISQSLPSTIAKVDVWIDRAVLHFLLEEEEIERYFKNIYALVKKGGYVLLAEFSTTGAKQCASLPLHQYSIEEMTQRMGKMFELIDQEEYTYINPAGNPRPYVYALFRRSI